MRVLLGLIAWSLVEIALFVTVGSWVGVLGTLAIVLGSGVAGVWVLRQQGVQLGQALRQNMGPGRDPVAHSGLVGLGAVFLILPGFLTDMIGLALLVPPVRAVIIARIGSRLRTASVHQTYVRPQDDVIEAVVVEHRPDGKPSGWTKP
jgi:UPF0716 protein FxsA